MHETPKVIRKVSIIQLIIQNQTMPYEKFWRQVKTWAKVVPSWYNETIVVLTFVVLSEVQPIIIFTIK